MQTPRLATPARKRCMYDMWTTAESTHSSYLGWWWQTKSRHRFAPASNRLRCVCLAIGLTLPAACICHQISGIISAIAPSQHSKAYLSSSCGILGIPRARCHGKKRTHASHKVPKHVARRPAIPERVSTMTVCPRFTSAALALASSLRALATPANASPISVSACFPVPICPRPLDGRCGTAHKEESPNQLHKTARCDPRQVPFQSSGGLCQGIYQIVWKLSTPSQIIYRSVLKLMGSDGGHTAP